MLWALQQASCLPALQVKSSTGRLQICSEGWAESSSYLMFTSNRAFSNEDGWPTSGLPKSVHEADRKSSRTLFEGHSTGVCVGSSNDECIAQTDEKFQENSSSLEVGREYSMTLDRAVQAAPLSVHYIGRVRPQRVPATWERDIAYFDFLYILDPGFGMASPSSTCLYI